MCSPRIAPMTWRHPEQIQKSRRTRMRALVVWGVFGLLVLAALGLERFKLAASRLALSAPIEAGPLVAQVPEGWRVSHNPEAPRIRATTQADGVAQDLTIMLHRRPEPLASPLAFLRFEFPAAMLHEAGQSTRIGGRPAMVVSFRGTLGPSGESYLTIAVVQVDPTTFLTIELQRIGEWNNADPLIVKQVARTVRVKGIEPGE